MTTKPDEALSIANPRLLAAVYFCLLAIIVTFGINALMSALGKEALLPLHQALLLTVVVASGFGALFGKKILISSKPYTNTVFAWAVLMVICAVPIDSLGLLYFIHKAHPEFITQTTFFAWIQFYITILYYNYIYIGSWMALFAGIAAMYLRGVLVYYLLDSVNQKRQNKKKI